MHTRRTQKFGISVFIGETAIHIYGRRLCLVLYNSPKTPYSLVRWHLVCNIPVDPHRTLAYIYLAGRLEHKRRSGTFDVPTPSPPHKNSIYIDPLVYIECVVKCSNKTLNIELH